jgi:hypothetical protein
VAAFWAVGSATLAPAGAGVSASTSAAGLSSRSALEGGLADLAVGGEAFVLDLGDQFGTHPVDLAEPSGAALALLAVERLLSVSSALSRGRIVATLSRPNPVPIRPTWMSLPSLMTPAISERKAPLVVV